MLAHIDRRRFSFRSRSGSQQGREVDGTRIQHVERHGEPKTRQDRASDVPADYAPNEQPAKEHGRNDPLHPRPKSDKPPHAAKRMSTKES